MKKYLSRKLCFVCGLFLFVVVCSAQGVSLAKAAEAGQSSGLHMTELNTSGMVKILSENKGKAIVVCFWSTSCPACVKEIPELEALAARHDADEVKIMMINLDRSTQAATAFFGNTVPKAEQYHGSPFLARDYGVRSIPHLVLYDKNGAVFLNEPGYFPANMLEALLKRITQSS